MLTFENSHGGRANAPHANTNSHDEIITAGAPSHNDYPDGVPESSKMRNATILLAALQRGPVTTLMAREDLGVQAVAQRIMELRMTGHPIVTRRVWQEDSSGRQHRIAQYVLLGCAA